MSKDWKQASDSFTRKREPLGAADANKLKKQKEIKKMAIMEKLWHKKAELLKILSEYIPISTTYALYNMLRLFSSRPRK